LAASADIGALAPSRTPEAPLARIDANLVGLLAIELLLLCFFVMLTSVSRFDLERAQPVMESVRKSFTYPLAAGDDRALAGADSLGTPRAVRERLAKLIPTALPLGDVEPLDGGRRLLVALPAGGFFQADAADVSPLGRQRLAHIAAIIDEAVAGLPFTLTVALDPAAFTAAERAAALAAALAATGGRATALAVAFDDRVATDRVGLILDFADGDGAGQP
jgi:hypothetical protein